MSIPEETIKSLIKHSIELYDIDTISFIINNKPRFDDYFLNHNFIDNIINVLNILNIQNPFLENYDLSHNHTNNGIYSNVYFSKIELMTCIKSIFSNKYKQ